MNKMAQAESVITEKEWSSATDDRTRPWHYTNGYEFVETGHPARVGMGEYFSVGGQLLEYPGDPMGSGWNIVNCRCFTLFYTNKRAVGF